MGSSEDKSEIVKVNVWKKGNNFTIYAISLNIVRRTQHSDAKLNNATINRATCFDPMGSSSGL